MNINVHNADEIKQQIDSDDEYENTKASVLRQRKRQAQIGPHFAESSRYENE